MQAITHTRYGDADVLRVTDVPKPVPKDDDVLVAVYASSVNYANPALMKGKPLVVRFGSGLFRPKFQIPGGDIAGRVEAVGDAVTQFQAGDAVYGDLADCGFGAFAEYAVAPQSELALKPANLTFAEAAAVPQAGLVALQGLRNRGGIAADRKVLIYGAAGGNGTFAVQIAKAFGAEVTGVCSARSIDLVHSLGADHVIDRNINDFARMDQRYDLILATVGFRSIFDYKHALAPGGVYVMTGGTMKQIFQALLLGPTLSMAGGKTLCGLSHKTSQDDLIQMKELLEARKIKPVIDRQFSLSETAEAFRYYDRGRARGKVVITMPRYEST